MIQKNLTILIILYQENIDVVKKCLDQLKKFKVIIIDNANDVNLKNKLSDISEPTSNNYGKYLSINEIKNIVSPSNEDSMRVQKWLGKNNIQILNNYGDSLHCEGNISDLNTAFNITLKEEKNPGIYRSKLDYIIDPNKHDYSSYDEWLIDKQVNDRVKNNGSIE